MREVRKRDSKGKRGVKSCKDLAALHFIFFPPMCEIRFLHGTLLWQLTHNVRRKRHGDDKLICRSSTGNHICVGTDWLCPLCGLQSGWLPSGGWGVMALDAGTSLSGKWKYH